MAEPTSAGKRTRTESLPPRPAAEPAVQAAPASGARSVDASAAFDWSGAGPTEIAATGVAGATAPLPHGEQIQASFGRHDVRGVRVADDAAARTASAALGAEAYATGDRIAFTGAPDLRLAAHEAAHTVQQRGGVQLSDGVGRSGDRYEQHADRVADLVVSGQSAEATLDEMAGGGGGAGGAAVQRFDTPHHIELGDSVKGEPVTVTSTDGVPMSFTPGELAALVDYVGDATNLRIYSSAQLTQMKGLLASGCEDALTWDTVTGGNYSTESQANEKHFAPSSGGSDGDDFASQFIGHYRQALMLSLQANGHDPVDADKLAEGRLEMYTAEHYLEDAFSAGHQIAAIDVQAAVEELVGYIRAQSLAPLIADGVWARASSTIQQYEHFSVWRENPGLIAATLLGPLAPLTGVRAAFVPFTHDTFKEVARAGMVITGVGGMADGMRKFVHELLEQGVEVTSPAHPEPWTLVGDHGLAEDGAHDRATNIGVIQAALADAREVFESCRPDRGPASDPLKMAQDVFARHRPIPTAAGQATVSQALAESTKDRATLVAALIDSMSGTIEGVMDYLTYTFSPAIRKPGGQIGENPERPDIPAFEGGGVGDGAPATDPGSTPE